MPRGRKPKGYGGSAASALPNMQAALSALSHQRAMLDEQIDAVSRAISALGGSGNVAMPKAASSFGGGASATGKRGPGRPAGRPPRKGSLKDYILRVLGGGSVMAVKDITDGIMRAGFKTKNKTLAKSVGIALTQLKAVRKVGRGQFKLG